MIRIYNIKDFKYHLNTKFNINNKTYSLCYSNDNIRLYGPYHFIKYRSPTLFTNRNTYPYSIYYIKLKDYLK